MYASPPVPIPNIRNAHQKLNNNTAPGPDGLTAELFNTGEEKPIRRLWKVVENIWMEERIPGQWEEGLICPTYKQRAHLACENYCGISLLNTAYKVFSNILFQRQGSYVEKIVGNYQCGFRDGISTSDQLHTVRQILGKVGEYGIIIFHLFIDFKATYDITDRT